MTSRSKKSFVVITGASRGIGKAIALQCGERFLASSVFVLMARGIAELEKTKTEMKAIAPNVTVVTKYFDQGNLEQSFIDSVFKNILSENKLETDMFEQSVMVHNSGVLGDLATLASDMTQVAKVTSLIDTNVTGMVLLNSAFFQLFGDSSKSRLIVNITSCASVLPLPLLGLYCSAKAARDMYLQVLTKETPSVRVLTYHPGRVDTAIFRKFTDECPEEYRDMYSGGEIMTPDVAVDIMMKFLEENTFENGAHVCGVGACSQFFDKK